MKKGDLIYCEDRCIALILDVKDYAYDEIPYVKILKCQSVRWACKNTIEALSENRTRD